MRFCLLTPQAIRDEDDVDIFDTYVPSGTYHTSIVNMLWAMYRYRALICCRDEWVQRFKDRCNLLAGKWNTIFDKYAAAGFESSLLSMDTSAATSHSYTENQDFPENVIAAGDKYISDATDTDSSASSQDGLAAKIFNDIMEAKADPYYIYAKEFDSLFSEFA